MTDIHTPFKTTLQVALLDSAGESVIESIEIVTAAIGDNPGSAQVWDPGNSDLVGTRLVQSRRGMATFTDLALPKASLGQGYTNEGYTIVFIVGSLRTQTSVFWIQPSEWAGLLILPNSQPVTATAGRPFDVQVRVMLIDAYENKLLPNSAPVGTRIDAQLLAQSSTPPALQRHACQEVCVGLEPTVCTTCSDKSLDAKDGEVLFTDLRIDASAQGYRLRFTSSFFEETSQAFDVVNSAPSYLHMEQQPSVANRADRELGVQPIVSMHDLFGNLILQDSVTAHTIEAQILTLGGLPSAAGFSDVPGQKPNTICTVSDVPLAGRRFMNATNAIAAFTDLAVRPSMSGFRLIFFGTTRTGLITATSNEFAVEPGEAVGLCNMTLPGRCSTLSPCLDAAIIACVDAFGNVQPTCETCLGSTCEIRPYGRLPTGMDIPCFGKVCVSVIEPEGASLHIGSGGTDGLNCAVDTCGVDIDTVSGFATFTQLVPSVPSPKYIFKFTAYMVHAQSRMVYEWTYISSRVNNMPPQPVLSKATFSISLSSILLVFDKPTNMNRDPGRERADSCDAVLERTFVMSLGLGPDCTWLDPSSYLVIPGPGASAGPTSQVTLNNASYIVYSSVFSGAYMTSLPASTTEGRVVAGVPLVAVMISLPNTIPTPIPIPLGPEQMSSCDLLSLDASLSQGSASRPFTSIAWSIDYDRSFLYQGLLTSDGSTLEFMKRRIHFSTRLPNHIATVTITLRPSAPVEANSTISISGIPEYRMSSSGCPAKPFHLGRPCLKTTDECMAVDLTGPSAFKFASQLTEDPLERRGVPVSWWQVGGVEHLFAKIDLDGSYYISQVEFTNVLKQTGDFVSNDRSRQRFETVDSNGDDLLSEEEFVSTRPITGVSFAFLDLDESFTLNMTELGVFFSGAGAQDYVSNEQVLARFNSLDADENGEVSSFEFATAPALAMNSRHLQHLPAAFLGLGGGLQLQVHPSHYLAAGEDTVIQFQMQNPSLPYSVRPIGVSSLCVACTCSDRLCLQKTTQTFPDAQMKMNCPDQLCEDDAVFRLDDETLSISGSVSETSMVFGAHNRITLTFTTSHLLPSGSGLLLKGLPLLSRLPEGAAGQLNGEQRVDLCLTGRSSLELECRACVDAAPGAKSGDAFGSWLPEAGEIHMRVNNGSSLTAGQHEVSFRFYNPTTTLRAACHSSASGANMVGQDCPSTVLLTLQASYEYERMRQASPVVLATGGMHPFPSEDDR